MTARFIGRGSRCSPRSLTASVMRKGGRSAAVTVAAAVGLVWLGVVVADTRILVEEKLVQPGQKYVVEGYGDLAETARRHWSAGTLTGAGCCQPCSGTLRTTSWGAIGARSSGMVVSNGSMGDAWLEVSIQV